MTMLKRYAPHLLWLLPAIVFLFAGGAKLAGVPELHQSFQMMGLPGWFGYFIGACEVAGAVGLALPRTRRLAAVGLAIIMVAAAYFHIAYDVPSPVPAMVLLVMLIAVASMGWRGRHAAA